MVLPNAWDNNRAIGSRWDGESPSVWRAEVEVAGNCREGIVGDKIGSHSV
jgi:hypothetical protein